VLSVLISIDLQEVVQIDVKTARQKLFFQARSEVGVFHERLGVVAPRQTLMGICKSSHGGTSNQRSTFLGSQESVDDPNTGTHRPNLSWLHKYLSDYGGDQAAFSSKIRF
jgi:hypothetical protein